VWTMYLVLFLSSACLMTIELVAGRLVAPYVGVSLYTWTGIIGACLTGMSFGHLWGGWLADRGDARRWLSRMFFAAALLTSFLFVARPAIGSLAAAMASNGTPPLLGIFVLSMLFFGLPCFFLAAVSPLVYRMALQRESRVGVIVGRLAASGIFGSIAGTYATGFWLVPAFGTRAILIGITLALVTLGSYCVVTSPLKRTVTAAIAIALPLAAAASAPARAGIHCNVESAYYCIRVEVSKGNQVTGPVKKLRLDYLTHSGYRINDPEHLWYEYEQVVAWLLKATGNFRIQTLFLGGGGYILPHWVERHFSSKSVIDVVEVDPAVTDVALKEFVPEARRIRTYNMDARLALRSFPPNQQYDVIFGDVFSDLSVPYHLTTVEFTRLIEEHLAASGLYIMNVVDDKQHGPLIQAIRRTVEEVFPHVYVLPGTSSKSGRGPYILVASKEPIPWREWEEHPDRPRFDVLRLDLPRGNTILTDDYVPTDHLLLPVFSDRWRP
jgi:spermidine synthase